ncbi:MAG: hypothetical protein LBL24_03705, partial [Bacteroidales bacterium]|nr:hypothetical protein [Bacteroidales bacterium]
LVNIVSTNVRGTNIYEFRLENCNAAKIGKYSVEWYKGYFTGQSKYMYVYNENGDQVYVEREKYTTPENMNRAYGAYKVILPSSIDWSEGNRDKKTETYSSYIRGESISMI